MKPVLNARFQFCLHVRFWLPLVAAIASPLVPAAHADDGFFGDYLKTPVFFEMFAEDYCDSTNFDLLPDGEIYMYPLGIRDLSNFSWADSQLTKGERDYSWFLRMEDMKYLVPFIHSFDPEHRAFLRDWFEKWYEGHRNLQKPNSAAWDLMTTAIRSMVFTYYLKQLQLQYQSNPQGAPSEEDLTLISRLKDTLFDHQQHMAEPANFDHNSNHGMWEAIGLFESTRVFPSAQIEKLALERLILIVNKSVSDKGFHMEHSAAYHYYFLDWLQQYVAYLESLENFSWNGLQELNIKLQGMLEAAYFLQDHDGNMPAIGDTDQCRVLNRFRFETTTDEDGFCFDKEAGYAVYKDNGESDLRRYVIFNIQNKRPDLPYHYHDDVLAVYYNCKGEVILGDQGRFEYGYSPERSYFVSNAAHNAVIPAKALEKNPKNEGYKTSARFRNIFAKNLSFNNGGEEITFSGTLSYKNWDIRRQVLILKSQPVLEVTDSITGSVPAVVLWNTGNDVESIDRIGSSEDATHDAFQFEWVLVTAKQRRYSMSISVNGQSSEGEFAVDMYKGSEDPLLGWYAPAYLVKVPITLIAIRVTPASQSPVIVVTRVSAIE